MFDRLIIISLIYLFHLYVCKMYKKKSKQKITRIATTEYITKPEWLLECKNRKKFPAVVHLAATTTTTTLQLTQKKHTTTILLTFTLNSIKHTLQQFNGIQQ